MIVFTNILYSLLIGFAGTAIMFLLQLFFCFKIKPLVLKLIPTYLVIVASAFAVGLVVGIASASISSVSILSPVALGVSIIVGASLIGVACAWLAYAVIKITSPKNGR